MPALMLLWSSGAKSKGKTFLLLCILVNTLLSPHAVFMCSQPHKQTVFNSAFFFFFSSPVVVVITVVSVCGAGFSMKTEGSVDIVWCAWRGLKGFQGDRGCFR